MFVTVDAPTLHISYTINLSGIGMDLLVVNEVSFIRNLLLVFLAARLCTFFIINFDVNELTYQKLVEKAWRRVLFVI